MTDTLYPTHLAHRGEGTLPVPIAMIVCRECENIFAVAALWPQNAPAQCCYCGTPMQFERGDGGGFVKVNTNTNAAGGLCHE